MRCFGGFPESERLDASNLTSTSTRAAQDQLLWSLGEAQLSANMMMNLPYSVKGDL